MRPIGILHGMTVDVQMIELIPEPDGIVILVQINQNVSCHNDTGDSLLSGGKDDKVPIGNYGEIVVSAENCDIATGAGGSSESGVQLGSAHLPNDFACQIDFLKERVRTVRVDTGEV